MTGKELMFFLKSEQDVLIDQSTADGLIKQFESSSAKLDGHLTIVGEPIRVSHFKVQNT